MHKQNNEQFFALLRYALGAESSFDACPTEEEWRYIYAQGVRQSVIALLFTAVNRLRDEQEPPLALTMKWATVAEDVRALNELLNSESKRLTELFEAEGHRTAILKGQANARLYSDPMSRQPGDIDIFVDGGLERVAALLTRLGMIEEGEGPMVHHWHLPENEKGVGVEVHFQPLAEWNGDYKHFNRIDTYLQEQFEKGTTLCPEGFRVPSMSYALVMQLSHLQKHAISSGIGLRQVIDYYVLLNHSTQEERQQVSSMLKYFAMKQFAAALMWCLEETLHLPADKMIAKPNSYRGQWLLNLVMQGGNFGFYKQMEEKKGILHSVWKTHVNGFRRMILWPELSLGVVCTIMHFWSHVIKTIPERIRRGKVFLSE